MWVTTLITVLEYARVGALNVQALIAAVKAGRAQVTHDDGTVATPESIAAALASLEAHAEASGDDTIARLARLAREADGG